MLPIRLVLAAMLLVPSAARADEGKMMRFAQYSGVLLGKAAACGVEAGGLTGIVRGRIADMADGDSAARERGLATLDSMTALAAEKQREIGLENCASVAETVRDVDRELNYFLDERAHEEQEDGAAR